jgi:DNA-binding NtrC family response regulator
MTTIRLLLVDDEARFVETLGKRLASRGYLVSTAHSGTEALSVLRECPVDVVLLDVRMPGMDGIETLREIRARHPGVQVIMLSGNASVNSAVEGMRLGAVDYLLKPAALEEVQAKIAEAVEKGRAERSDPHTTRTPR